MLESQRQKVRELDDKLRSCDESYLREALTGTYDEEKMKAFDAKSAKRNYDFLQNSIEHIVPSAFFGRRREVKFFT